MTELEVKELIQGIPIGSKLELIKKNGDIVQVMLASHDVSGTEQKDYGAIVVPALPSALTVLGNRFGKYRIDTDDIVKIAWVE